MFALVARKAREQQLARAIHNILSHSIKILFTRHTNRNGLKLKDLGTYWGILGVNGT